MENQQNNETKADQPAGKPKIPDEAVKEVIQLLLHPPSQADSLWKLVKWQKQVPDLAVKLWNAPGVIIKFVVEICSIYRQVRNRELTVSQSKIVCNIIELLKCIANHPATRYLCIQANLPAYLIPFLSFVPNQKIYEKPCAATLNVLCALAEANDPVAMNYVLEMDFVNVCLNAMQNGSAYLKTTGAYTLMKFLETDLGFSHVRQNVDCISKIISTLGSVVQTLTKRPLGILLKFTLRCYGQMSKDECIREELRMRLPLELRDNTLKVCFKDDQRVGLWVYKLLNDIYSNSTSTMNDRPYEPRYVYCEKPHFKIGIASVYRKIKRSFMNQRTFRGISESGGLRSSSLKLKYCWKLNLL